MVAGSSRAVSERKLDWREVVSAIPSVLFAIYFFVSSAFCYLVAAIITVITAPFDPDRKVVHLFGSLWAFHYVVMNPWWKCRFEGRENIKPNLTCVFVSNHQSLADIVVLYGLFTPFKWVSKDSILKIPFIGGNMRLNQYVTISRGSLKSIKEMLGTCRTWLKRDVSLMIFPEGTRTSDGEIQTYREGAFKLCRDCNVPVVPIVLDGTRTVLPKGGKMCFATNITVKILPAVHPDQFDRDHQKLPAHVEDISRKALQEIRSDQAQGAA